MAFKLVIIACLLAVANAGYVSYAAPAVIDHHVGATHESTVRGFGGNSAVTHYSKAVDSAFSSVRKYDTRISNDAFAYAPAYAAAYHAPAVAAVHAAPAVAAYHAPAVAAYHAPAVAAYHAPAVAAYHAPAVATGLVGTAYSAAPAVAHLAFDGFGVHYGY